MLIHPHTFYRLNDGVVQAALLRAAFPTELNYAISPEHSGEMVEVIRFIFSELKTERGEASVEFAVALAMGQLRLCLNDRKFIAKYLLSVAPEGSILKYLAQFIQNEPDI